MAEKVKSVQVGGTKKLVMDVVKTIFVVFMFLFYMMPFILVIINSLKRKVNIVKNPLMLIDDKGVQLVNYVKAFTEMAFGTAFFMLIHDCIFICENQLAGMPDLLCTDRGLHGSSLPGYHDPAGFYLR